MGNSKTPVTEWDDEERADETSNRTYPRFLAHWVLNLWPVVTLAVLMVGVSVWFYHHP
jgi:hypothetical protein